MIGRAAAGKGIYTEDNEDTDGVVCSM